MSQSLCGVTHAGKKCGRPLGQPKFGVGGDLYFRSQNITLGQSSRKDESHPRGRFRNFSPWLLLCDIDYVCWLANTNMTSNQ